MKGFLTHGIRGAYRRVTKPLRWLAARKSPWFEIDPRLAESIKQRFKSPEPLNVIHGLTKDYHPLIIGERAAAIGGRKTFRCTAFDPKTREFLSEIQVVPVRGGYASALVEHTIAFGKRNGFRVIVPHVGNEQMKRFFLKRGARERGTGVEWTPDDLEKITPRPLKPSKTVAYNP